MKLHNRINGLSKVQAALLAGLAISAYFVTSQPVTPALAVVSSLSVIAFALPSYWAVIRSQGRGRGLAILALLGMYALLVESSALATGFPYGDFTYTDVLGTKVFELTPWTVAFAYPPILLLAFTIARWFTAKSAQTQKSPLTLLLSTAAVTAIVATACDFVLDPAAVRLGFWYWDQPGWYYGVPWVNFAGWLLSSFVGGLLLHMVWNKHIVTPAVAYSGLAILWFWTAANAWLAQWLPVTIGLLLGFCFWRALRYDA